MWTWQTCSRCSQIIVIYFLYLSLIYKESMLNSTILFLLPLIPHHKLCTSERFHCKRHGLQLISTYPITTPPDTSLFTRILHALSIVGWLYIWKKYSYRLRHVCVHSNIWVSLFVDIGGGSLSRESIIGNLLCRPPRPSHIYTEYPHTWIGWYMTLDF